MLVLIKGAGDLATGTAVRLYRAGIPVVMTEVARPTAVRRTVAFSQCMYDGAAQVEGISARRAEDAKAKTTQTEGGYTVTGEGDPAIDALVMQRYEAKKAKNFAEADRIRDELKAQGIEIIDTKGGASWKRV